MTPAAIALAALLPAALLAADPNGWQPFGPAKWLAISTLAFVAVALALREGPWTVARRPMLAWAAFLVWITISAVFAVDRVYAWTGTPERHLGIVTWLLCALLFAAAQTVARRSARVIVVGALVAAIGVGAWATVEALGWQPIAIADAGGRLTGPFGSAAYLGAAGALLLPLVAGLAADRAAAAPVRWASGGAAVLLVIAVVGSGTRAAWVGLAVAALVAVTARRVPRRLVAVAGGIVAALAVVAVIATPVGARLGDTFDADSAGGRGRLDEWRVATRVVAERPLLGAGPEGYRIAFADGVDAAYERAHGRAVLPDRAHDSVLDIAVTAGVPGALLYLLLIAVIGPYVWRALRRGPMWLAGLAAGLVAYAAQSLFLFPTVELEPVAWILAGVTVAATANASELTTVRVPRWTWLAPAVLGGLALVAGVLDVAADRDARQALRALAAGDVARGAHLANHVAALRPDVVRYQLLAARADADTGDLDAALHRVDDALDVSRHDPIARQLRATLLSQTADLAGALGAWQALVDGDPDNAAYQLQLGVAAVRTGNLATAEAAWLRADDLAPRSAAPATNLAELYRRQGRLAEADAAAARARSRTDAAP